ncbi:MAG: lipoate--protein ligase family protein [Elusimicrobiota bacterium]
MAIEISSAPVLEAFDAAQHMGMDEAALALSAPTDLALRFYRWKESAVTFGYGQRRAVAAQLAAAKGFLHRALVRRPTGGGVVFHDGDITFSIVFPWKAGQSPREIYATFHDAVLKEISALPGLKTLLWSGLGPARPLQSACFSHPSPSDVVDAAGRKILGGALRRNIGRGLYQGSLRAQALAVRRGAIEEAIVTAAAGCWGQNPMIGFPDSWMMAGRLLADKYRGREWNEKR